MTRLAAPTSFTKGVLVGDGLLTLFLMSPEILQSHEILKSTGSRDSGFKLWETTLGQVPGVPSRVWATPLSPHGAAWPAAPPAEAESRSLLIPPRGMMATTV